LRLEIEGRNKPKDRKAPRFKAGSVGHPEIQRLAHPAGWISTNRKMLNAAEENLGIMD
jgi:hypothetical protein